MTSVPSSHGLRSGFHQEQGSDEAAVIDMAAFDGGNAAVGHDGCTVCIAHETGRRFEEADLPTAQTDRRRLDEWQSTIVNPGGDHMRRQARLCAKDIGHGDPCQAGEARDPRVFLGVRMSSASACSSR